MPLTNDEKEMVQGEIINFLNSSKRELLPNEERVIKKIAQKYNFFNTIFTIIAVLAGLGLITFTTNVLQEKAKLAAEKDLEALKKVAQKDLKEIKKEAVEEVKTTLEEARNETNDYKKYARDLLMRLYKSSGEAETLSDKIKMEINKINDIESKVELKTTEAKAKITDLDETLRAISKKEKILKDKKWIFDMLKDPSVNQLKIHKKEDEEQYSFNFGELLLVWGKGRTKPRDGWTDIHFNQNFDNKNEMAICVIANGRDKEKAAYPVVRRVTEDMIEFRFVRKKSGVKGYHDVNNVDYSYIAMGRVGMK